MHFIADFRRKRLKNTYGINNKSNGVVRMYVTTSVTHKPGVRMICSPSCNLRIILRWNRTQSYAPFITYSGIAMFAKFPCVSKRPIVPGIIELPKFTHEYLEENVAGGQGSFGVYW